MALVVKNLPPNARDTGPIPGPCRFLEGNGSLFQSSCLGNPMDRKPWWATVHEVTNAVHNLVSKQQPFQVCQPVAGLKIIRESIMCNSPFVLRIFFKIEHMFYIII